MKRKSAWKHGEEYAFEKIMEYHLRKGKGRYLIKWKGYAHTENSWEPEHFIPKIERDASP
jgi:hypothetical protein